MLNVNVQPVSYEATKALAQDSKAQGTSIEQDDSSFSSMLEKEQNLHKADLSQANSTDNNKKTNNVDSKELKKHKANKFTESKKLDNKTILNKDCVSSLLLDSNLQTTQAEDKITVAQIDFLQTLPKEFNQDFVLDENQQFQDDFFTLSEINSLLKDELVVTDFDKKTDTKNTEKSNFSKITKNNISKKDIDVKSAKDFVKEKIKEEENFTEDNSFQQNIAKSSIVKDDISAKTIMEKVSQNLNETLEPKIEDKINIIDERTTASLQTTQKSGVSKENAKTGNFVKSVEYDSNGNANVTMNVGQNLNQVVDVNGNPKTNEFSSLLSKEIQNSTQEIVQSGSMILKDNNAGTINLILKPESLGTVKIKLEISDNQITGKILVASKEAYDAFNQNLNVLKNAFIDSGFNAGGFDLAFTGSGMNGHFNGENNQHADARPNAVNSKGKVYEESLSEVIPDSYVSKDSVNLVA